MMLFAFGYLIGMAATSGLYYYLVQREIKRIINS